jgi:Nif-specific regulatory protein
MAGQCKKLENTIERLVVMSKGTSWQIRPAGKYRGAGHKDKILIADKGQPSFNSQVIEKTRILDALNKTGWVQARAAKLLGITPRQIGYKIMRYGLKQ